MNVPNLISSEHLRYRGTKLLNDGSTELYNEDILNYIRALI